MDINPQILDYDTHYITVTRQFYDLQDSTYWLTLTVNMSGASEEFEFAISLLEGMKDSNRDLNGYIYLATKNVSNYLRRFGIRGNQTHIFDFFDSDFIPRENIDWP